MSGVLTSNDAAKPQQPGSQLGSQH